MKSRITVFCLLSLGFCVRAAGQSFSIDWSTISGGGGTSTGGLYAVSGTIGQPAADNTMTGGNYSLNGGFWSFIGAVRTAGVPDLVIVPSGPNSVKVLWPDTGNYTLLQTATLSPDGGGWTTSGYFITTANGTNSITITPPTGNLFFRLQQ